MVDKTPGDRKLSVPAKTLSLKPRVETGTVKQSFSHGRTKQVVVEKRGRRPIGGECPATWHAPHRRRSARHGARAGTGRREGSARQGADDPSRHALDTGAQQCRAAHAD